MSDNKYFVSKSQIERVSCGNEKYREFYYTKFHVIDDKAHPEFSKLKVSERLKYKLPYTKLVKEESNS